MSVITTGELEQLYYVAETVYGTTPPVGTIATLTWGADLLQVKDTTDFQRTFDYISDSRAYGVTTRGMAKCGFDAKCYARNNATPYFWTNFFALYALGAVGAVTEHLPSFSAQISIKQGAAYQRFLYNGCKMTKLVMGSEGVGRPIVFDASILARYVSYSTSKAFSGLQSLTLGADPGDPIASSDPVSWLKKLGYTLSGGATTDLLARTWKLTIDNHLQAMPANILSGATYYPIASTIEEENREIIFEATIPAQDQTFETAKRNGTAMTSLTIPADNKTITLSNGYFDDTDFPTYKQGLNDENIKIHFKTITIA